MNKILIIDDDPDLCSLVATILERDGYQVATAYEGQTGLEQVRTFKPDLVLLDIMMPGDSGWAVCEQLSQAGGPPVIFLSARGSEGDIVRGLRLGADDYIAKPFRRHELLARIEAVLRRALAPTSDEDTIYQVADLTIDPARWDVRRDSESIHLTPTEFKLLLLLARNAGRPVPHDEILNTVWGAEHQQNLNLLKVYIRQLRQKIEADPDRPGYILTKRGVGYYLTP